MASSFLFFTTVVGNENLLKEELRFSHKNLNLSFSKKGFITFKSVDKAYDLNDVKRLDFTFALRYGIQTSKAREESIEEKVLELCSENGFDPASVHIHIYSVDGIELNIPDGILRFKNINEKIGHQEYFINIVQAGINDYWLGISYLKRDDNPFVAGDPSIELPENSPSRAYLKMAEANEVLNLKFQKSDVFIEYGCAPGGTCLYLLNQNFRVIGVDPAIMAPICLEHSKFTHLKFPLQDLAQEDLPNSSISWVTVDLNLNPKQAIKEVLRLSKRDTRTLKGILFTIKIVQLHHVSYIEKYKDEFLDFGAKFVKTLQLPSHRQEFLLYAKF